MFPFSTPRLILAGIAVLALMATAGGLYWKVRHDQHERDKAAIEAAQAAQRQAEVTTTALDQHATRTVIIREQTDAAIQVIQTAPGSDSPLPSAVLDAWRRGMQHNPGADNPDSPASVP